MYMRPIDPSREARAATPASSGATCAGPGSLPRCGLSACRPLGARGLPRRRGPLGGRTGTGGGVSVPGERAMRRSRMSLSPKRTLDGGRATLRRPVPGALRTARARSMRLGRCSCAPSAARDLYARPSSLRKADGDGLPGRPCTVLALADVVHFLFHELSRLSRRGFSFTLVAPGAGIRCFLGHLSLPCCRRGPPSDAADAIRALPRSRRAHDNAMTRTLGLGRGIHGRSPANSTFVQACAFDTRAS